jgi:hypothetical protein
MKLKLLINRRLNAALLFHFFCNIAEKFDAFFPILARVGKVPSRFTFRRLDSPTFTNNNSHFFIIVESATSHVSLRGSKQRIWCLDMTMQPHTELLQLFDRTLPDSPPHSVGGRSNIWRRADSTTTRKLKWLFVSGYKRNSLIYIMTGMLTRAVMGQVPHCVRKSCQQTLFGAKSEVCLML